MWFEGAFKYLFVFLTSLTVCVLLVPLAELLSKALGIIDYPRARGLNLKPVPRAGGLAVFTAFTISSAIVFASPLAVMLAPQLSYDWWIATIGVGGALVLCGLLDDRFGLAWYLKLFVQVLAATAMFFLGVRLGSIQGIALPPTIDFVLTVLWFLGFINAFNLIDGMDGLASGLAAIAALGLSGFALLRGAASESLVLLALAGACIGFLRFNFHPARIFLGDCGSMFLGFALASISLFTGTKSPTLAAIGVPLLAVGVPIFDTMLAIWRRSMRRVAARFSADESRSGSGTIMSADMDHLHHRLLKSGLNQKKAALVLYGVNIALVSLGILNVMFSAQALGISIIAFVVGSYVVVRHLARVELWDSGTALLIGLRRPSRTVLASILYPFLDALFLTLTLALSLYLSKAHVSFEHLRLAFTATLPLFCGIPFVCLFLSGTYSRVWSRARVSEFVILVAALASGFLIAGGIMLLLHGPARRDLVTLVLLAFGLSGALISGVRALPRAVQDIMGQMDASAAYPDRAHTRVLIYGAGFRGLLYLKNRVYTATNGNSDKKVVGFIDDDLNLRKRMVHGHRVLGSGVELHSIIARNKIHEIVIASDIRDARRARVQTLAQQHGIRVVEWSINETELVAGQTVGELANGVKVEKSSFAPLTTHAARGE